MQLNAQRRLVRARIEHAFARMKTYKILSDYRCAGTTLAHTAASIANLHNMGGLDPVHGGCRLA